MSGYWQEFLPAEPPLAVWTDSYAATMPDGTRLLCPLRDFGDWAVAGMIANQASFPVVDRLSAWMADAARPFAPEIVVGLPTLGHVFGAGVARALGHSNWVAPGTTRKLWYEESLSVPTSSITAPASLGADGRRMWLDPRLLPRLHGRRVLLVDDVISTGSSALAGLRLLHAAGVAPVALCIGMVQGRCWEAGWPGTVPVVRAFETPIFRRVEDGWV